MLAIMHSLNRMGHLLPLLPGRCRAALINCRHEILLELPRKPKAQLWYAGFMQAHVLLSIGLGFIGCCFLLYEPPLSISLCLLTTTQTEVLHAPWAMNKDRMA